MNATRKQRLCLVIGVLAAAALAVTLIVFALQRNMSYLFTPARYAPAQRPAISSSGSAAWSRPARSSARPIR